MTTSQQTIVAVFPDRTMADQARQELLIAGIASHEITTRDRDTDTSVTSTKEDRGGFWSWLFGDEVSDELPYSHRQAYRSRYESGETLMTVTAVDSETEYDRVTHILERNGAVDLDTSDETFRDYQYGWHSEGATDGSMSGGTVRAGSRLDTLSDGSRALREEPAMTQSQRASYTDVTAQTDAGPRSGRTEEVIPVIKEELRVGKRLSSAAKTYRVRTTVSEVPVTEQVSLHEERVTVERRAPTTRATLSG